MIVTPTAGGLRVITQNDHAHFAAEILSLWRADGFPDHPRRREILLAAREHDNGWGEADSAPFHNPANGRPHDFLTLPAEERRRIWRRGPRRWAEREPWAAALITEHARHLHRVHRGEADWADIFAAWDEQVEALMETAELTRQDLAADYPWIDLSDALSLAVCAGWTAPVDRPGVRALPSDGHLALDPFPLAGSTTFEVSCRTIPDRPYTSDSDLAVALATARWERYRVRLVPAA